MHENELKHIGNQLYKMTEEELHEVLAQLKEKYDCTSETLISKLKEILLAERFDYYGNIEEEEYLSHIDLEDKIEEKLRAICILYPFDFYVEKEFLSAIFFLTLKINPQTRLIVTPIETHKTGKYGTICWEHEGVMVKSHYNSYGTFVEVIKNWMKHVVTETVPLLSDQKKFPCQSQDITTLQR